MGGKSSEREVSLTSGRMIMEALDTAKYNSFAVDTACFGGIELDAAAAKFASGAEGVVYTLDHLVAGVGTRPDVVFIALHGRFGEDGTVQGMLELLGIPYVGSGVLASAIAIDKLMSRKIFHADGIPIAKGFGVERSSSVADIRSRVRQELGFPVVVKPSREGSSIGLSIVQQEDEFESALCEAFRHDKDVLLEEYISGIEITAPVIGNDDLKALPLIEILPAHEFYDYHSKYADGGSEHVIPARIGSELSTIAQELAIQCHRSLGCRGMSRTDMIVRGQDIFVLEVNTIPGMTSTSLLPQSAKAIGIEFPELLDTLIGYALEKG